MLTIKDNVLNDFSLKATISGNNPEIDLQSSSLNVLGQSEIKNFSINKMENSCCAKNNFSNFEKQIIFLLLDLRL